MSDQSKQSSWLRHPLVRDIVYVLVFKVCALVFLYFAFFGPDKRVPEDLQNDLLNAEISYITERSGGDV